ncbi:hypothetical protein [Gymnodinialimonas hymeniacidonis]|uniref:hypothetical protein n=1 Tax=Gymnodinialimonas hymeniacidonis TaxID=3126508 RepID=UPI0034C6B31B
MSFSDTFKAQLPNGMSLPDAFADTFDWLEAQGWAGQLTYHPDPESFARNYLSIYPPKKMEHPNASFVLFSFEAGPPLAQPPKDVKDRFVKLATIAGDGGILALWLDEKDAQHFVVFNHGIPHVLTQDPLVALQFLAIGYPEPAAANPNLTAEEQALQDGGDPPLLPEAFRSFLEERFDVVIPARASDLGIVVPADDASDPVRDYLDRFMPEDSSAAAPHIEFSMLGLVPDQPFAITPELRSVLSDAQFDAIRQAFPYISEEE